MGISLDATDQSGQQQSIRLNLPVNSLSSTTCTRQTVSHSGKSGLPVQRNGGVTASLCALSERGHRFAPGITNQPGHTSVVAAVHYLHRWLCQLQRYMLRVIRVAARTDYNAAPGGIVPDHFAGYWFIIAYFAALVNDLTGIGKVSDGIGPLDSTPAEVKTSLAGPMIL